MRTVIEALFAAVLVVSPVYAQVPDTKMNPSEGSPGGTKGLPPMGFASTIASDEIYGALKQTATFTSMDKDKPGNPVVVRVSHTYGHTPAGTASAIASAFFAGATLGILPVVSTRALVVTYEIMVNDSVLLSYSYSKNVTRVFNIHSTDKTYGLGADGLAWVTGTAAQFTNEAARDPKYAELQAEYHYYYDTPAETSAR
jgi:hypothetical protein